MHRIESCIPQSIAKAWGAQGNVREFVGHAGPTVNSDANVPMPSQYNTEERTSRGLYSGVALLTHAGRDRNAYFPSRCGSVDELNSKNVNVAVADVGDHFHVPVSWIGPTALCIRLVTIRDIVRE